MPSNIPRLTIRMKQETIDKIKIIAEIEHRSANEQVNYIIDKYLKEYEAKQERESHKQNLEQSSISKTG